MWFDLLLLAILVGSLFTGFHQGVIRQGLNLFAIIFGVLVGATYSPRAARFYEGMVGQTNDFVRNTLMFVLLVILVWVGVNVAVFFAFRQTKLQTGQTLDRLLGLVVGLVNGIIWASILIIVVGFMTRVQWPDYDGVRQLFASGLTNSILRPTFMNIIPELTGLIRVVVPGGNLPPILMQSLNQ